MAKRRSNSASPSSNTPAAPAARLPFELRQDLGDNSGARRLANAALADSASSDDVKNRAKEVLNQVKLDSQPLMMFAGMLLLLSIVFATFILSRNHELPTTPGAPVVNKETVLPPANTVPADEGETHGTP